MGWSRGDPTEWDDSRPALPLCDLPETHHVSLAACKDKITSEWFNRFSDYDCMLRVVAYMCRFVWACRRNVALRRSSNNRPFVSLQTSESIDSAFLLKAELDRAAQVLAADSRRVYFSVLLRELSAGNRISSTPLARLSPFVDPAGVLRVGGWF